MKETLRENKRKNSTTVTPVAAIEHKAVEKVEDTKKVPKTKTTQDLKTKKSEDPKAQELDQNCWYSPDF